MGIYDAIEAYEIASIVNLREFKQRKLAQAEHAEHVRHEYRMEIEQWCGHDLACEIVANRLDISERIVRNIVTDHLP